MNGEHLRFLLVLLDYWLSLPAGVTAALRHRASEWWYDVDPQGQTRMLSLGYKIGRLGRLGRRQDYKIGKAWVACNLANLRSRSSSACWPQGAGGTGSDEHAGIFPRTSFQIAIFPF